ncbi:MAPEG family protein [Pannus brasiliensis CCIBt3594]|uniref:MAPEG family protein n=1 Tax=Pannus brasiliensis CCIBt3594 TaxID=1427578 RepID=A0AAW9QV66_9CHRO
MNAIVPISTLFIGINGFIAFFLSYLVVMERSSTRVWHGESSADVAKQPDYRENPNPVAAVVESFLEKSVPKKSIDDGILQRKVRAFGNFIEFVPIALLIILVLEFANAPAALLWLLGSALTSGRVAHAWGLITTYGPSPGRAIGFFLTWFVYLLGSGACVYYGLTGVLG